MVLTEGHRRRLARRIAQDLPDRADVLRMTRTRSEDDGSWTDTPAVVAVRVPIRLAPVSGRDVALGGSIASEATHVASLPADTDLLTSDRLRIGLREFGIVEIRTRSQELVRRVYLVERT